MDYSVPVLHSKDHHIPIRNLKVGKTSSREKKIENWYQTFMRVTISACFDFHMMDIKTGNGSVGRFFFRLLIYDIPTELKIN